MVVYLGMKRVDSPWPEDGGPEVCAVFSNYQTADKWEEKKRDKRYKYWVEKWQIMRSWKEYVKLGNDLTE